MPLTQPTRVSEAFCGFVDELREEWDPTVISHRDQLLLSKLLILWQAMAKENRTRISNAQEERRREAGSIAGIDITDRSSLSSEEESSEGDSQYEESTVEGQSGGEEGETISEGPSSSVSRFNSRDVSGELVGMGKGVMSRKRFGKGKALMSRQLTGRKRTARGAQLSNKERDRLEKRARKNQQEILEAQGRRFDEEFKASRRIEGRPMAPTLMLKSGKAALKKSKDEEDREFWHQLFRNSQITRETGQRDRDTDYPILQTTFKVPVTCMEPPPDNKGVRVMNEAWVKLLQDRMTKFPRAIVAPLCLQVQGISTFEDFDINKISEYTYSLGKMKYICSFISIISLVLTSLNLSLRTGAGEVLCPGGIVQVIEMCVRDLLPPR